MLPKEEREIIAKIGRYKYNKMKKLNLTYEEFVQYEKRKQDERKLKQKIGYEKYQELQELGMTLEEYGKFLEETKYKNRQKCEEKNKIRFRTIRYVERYCNLEMKCQICEDKAEIHHPNYKDYLKVNLLCKKHHTELHNFELVPPEIIDLKKIAIKKPPQKDKQKKIEAQIEDMKIDILKNNFSYRELSEKYNLSDGTIKKYLEKEESWSILENKLKKAGKKSLRAYKMKNTENPLQKYRIENDLTIEELSNITQIPVPTIRAIECGRTDVNKIKQCTKKKLAKILKSKINGD